MPEPANEPPSDSPSDSPRLSWTQPICERCWIERESESDGEMITSIRVPVRLIEPSIEQCSWCGKLTIFGAFKRADPATVPYPAEKTDDE